MESERADPDSEGLKVWGGREDGLNRRDGLGVYRYANDCVIAPCAAANSPMGGFGW